MNILYLGPYHEQMIQFLKSFGDTVVQTEEPITLLTLEQNNIDFLISYRYRSILKKEILDRFVYKAINLHTSYLPWNRGADPNIWSFLHNTLKGVTIHYLDSGIDTGDIIAQKTVEYMPSDTLKTSYNRLIAEIEALFLEIWPDVRCGNIVAVSQPIAGGTYHKKVDKEPYLHLLNNGWDTPVERIIGMADTKNLY
ncbi:formyltransferase family protein [Paenibacillus sp. SI8]|uniref:formyltransferase family protein n=1 Tax=unclassified Paenibacillus TaxID=185978 RepID=UPI0034666279